MNMNRADQSLLVEAGWGSTKLQLTEWIVWAGEEVAINTAAVCRLVNIPARGS